MHIYTVRDSALSIGIDFRMGKGMVLLSYLSFIWAKFKGYGGGFKKIHAVHH